MKRRLVILPSLPLNIFSDYLDYNEEITLRVIRVRLEGAVSYVRRFKHIYSEIKCFIRHEGTVKLLSELLGIELRPSSEVYRFDEDDDIMVVTLKRPVRGAEVEKVSPEDVDVFFVFT